MSALPQTPLAPLDRLGRPLRDLRLSVIEACNFRCGYCMPADKVPDDYGFDAAGRLSFDEIETLVRGATRLGMSSCASPVASRCCARGCRSSSPGCRGSTASTTWP